MARTYDVRTGNRDRFGGGDPGSRTRSWQRTGELKLLLSAVEIQPREAQFLASVLPYDQERFEALRGRDDIFVYRRKNERVEEQVVAIPLSVPPPDFPHPRSLQVDQNRSLFARLIERRLPALLPKLELVHTRFGLERVRRTEDLFDVALERARLKRTPLISSLHVFRRTEMHVRHEYMPGRRSFLSLTIGFHHTLEIEATVAELLARGARIDGLGLVSASDARFIGIASSVDGGVLHAATDHGDAVFDPSACKLEPSLSAFGGLLSQVFDRRALDRYESAEWSVRAETQSGDGYLKRLKDVADYFHKLEALDVAPGITIAFGGLINPSSSGKEPSATKLGAIEYCFSGDRTAIETMPVRGLDMHGPFDQRRFDKKEPRIAFAYPRDMREDVDRFAHRFLNGTSVDNLKRFARGFGPLYRLHKVSPHFIPIDLTNVPPHAIGDRYVDTFGQAFDPARRPDLVFVVVRDEDAFLEIGNPYIASKAYLLSQGLPSQQIRYSKLSSAAGDLQYILEDCAVASYAKMGGSPWTLASSVPLTKELVIGLAYAEFGGRLKERQRYMGIATVFTSDGNYVLAAQSPRCRYEDYPATLALTVKETLARLVEQYAWDTSEVVRLVFHTQKPLTKQDIETVSRVAVRELGLGVTFESAFLTIRRDHPFKVIDPSEEGRNAYVDLTRGGQGMARVAQRVPARGVVVDLGRSKRLVCTHGAILAIREGEGIPQPLLVELHRDSTYTNISSLAKQVYQFTGLNWGSMKPVSEPVTIHYARLIAKMLGRLDDHPYWSPALLDTHLRTSRWFL